MRPPPRAEILKNLLIEARPWPLLAFIASATSSKQLHEEKKKLKANVYACIELGKTLSDTARTISKHHCSDLGVTPEHPYLISRPPHTFARQLLT